MVVKALVSVEEYLKASFPSPEPDFVEGELVERAVPNTFHSSTQGDLFEAFRPWKLRGELFLYSEIRIRLGPEKFRVADFAVFAAKQVEAIPADMPCAVIEIISPDDRHLELMSKLAEYEEAGVEYVFVAEPPSRALFLYKNGSLVSIANLEMPRFGVAIPLRAIFASL